jgi:hypothetical protein
MTTVKKTKAPTQARWGFYFLQLRRTWQQKNRLSGDPDHVNTWHHRPSLKSKKPRLNRDGAFLNNFGGDLLSHTVAHAVSSAQ